MPKRSGSIIDYKVLSTEGFHLELLEQYNIDMANVEEDSKLNEAAGGVESEFHLESEDTELIALRQAVAETKAEK